MGALERLLSRRRTMQQHAGMGSAVTVAAKSTPPISSAPATVRFQRFVNPTFNLDQMPLHAFRLDWSANYNLMLFGTDSTLYARHPEKFTRAA